MSLDPSPWLVTPRPNPRARLHLVIYPYAGAGASAFYSWVPHLYPFANVSIVQLPGRESRMEEPPLRDLRLAARLLTDVCDRLADRPIAFFGHSLGALLAYETCLQIIASGKRAPYTLFLSGHSPPHVPRRYPPVYALPRDELLAHLDALGGTGSDVLSAPELIDYFEPILRADLEMNDRFECSSPVRLPLPLTVFTGKDDQYFPVEDAARWSDATAVFALHSFEGGHFYINQHRDAVVALMKEQLVGGEAAPARWKASNG